jgi:HEAT repeat protein
MTDTSSVIGEILGKLRTDDPPISREVKFAVVEELRGQDVSAVKNALVKALEDSDPEFRCTAAWVFLVYDFLASLPYVRTLLLHDEDDGVQGYLCEMLGASQRREAVPLLIEALTSDSDGTNRVIAAWGLGNIGDTSALPALTKAMQTDDGIDHEGRRVKDIAAEAIRRINEEKATASVA